MKVGIIGLGVVGSAVRYGLERLGHLVTVHDIKHDTRIADVLDSQIVFLCLPTPTGENGRCDTTAIENAVSDLLVDNDYRGIVAIKSTVTPGTTASLQHKFKNEKICHVPEFLRERAAVVDFTDNHDVCVIGTASDEVFDIVKAVHGNYPKRFVKLTPTEAELAKYFSNTYNAMLITFANGFYELCDAKGADYMAVKNSMVQRDHIFDKYLDCNENLRGFGGMCLPKDTAAIAAVVEDLGLKTELFRAIVEDNRRYETTVFKGMRK